MKNTPEKLRAEVNSIIAALGNPVLEAPGGGCDTCHKENKELLSFALFLGVRSWTPKGKEEATAEAMFTAESKLCFPCYKKAVDKELETVRHNNRIEKKACHTDGRLR
jgi:hypothetical protein